MLLNNSEATEVRKTNPRVWGAVDMFRDQALSLAIETFSSNYWEASGRKELDSSSPALYPSSWGPECRWSRREMQLYRDRQTIFRVLVCCACVLSCFSYIWLFANLWTVAHQAPLSMGILQTRILKWVAVPSSSGSSWPMDWTHVSYVSCIGRWVLYHWCHLGSPSVLFFELVYLKDSFLSNSI